MNVVWVVEQTIGLYVKCSVSRIVSATSSSIGALMLWVLYGYEEEHPGLLRLCSASDAPQSALGVEEVGQRF